MTLEYGDEDALLKIRHFKIEILDQNQGKIRIRDRESRLERSVFLRSFWFLVSTEADEVIVIKKISKQKL